MEQSFPTISFSRISSLLYDDDLMPLFAIADLHLSLGVPNKKMDIFGEKWVDHHQLIEKNWKEVIGKEDLVLLAGDFSWAMRQDEVKPDFLWLEELPGTKVMIKGNHDYWWQSLSKVRSFLPPSCHVIQNDVYNSHGISIGGARLWDSSEFSFNKEPLSSEDEAIFERELQRLELSLKQLDQTASHRIAMTHYPPIGFDLAPSRASHLFEKYHVDIVIFGHLHNFPSTPPLFGKKGNISYYLTSCDYLNFKPLKIL